MVRVKSSLFNYISGKSGNTVFRQMNGKTFYSIRPETYNISQSKKAKESRRNFGLAVKFAKIVNEQSLLKSVWSKAKIKGTTSYHRIIKLNIKYIKENKLSLFNSITPSGDLFPVESYIVSDESIILKLDNSSSQQISFYKFPFTLVSVIYLFNKGKKTFEDNLLLSFSNDFPKTLNNNIDTLSLDIPKNVISHFSKYQDCFIYLAAVFQNPNSGKISWTSTITIQFAPSE